MTQKNSNHAQNKSLVASFHLSQPFTGIKRWADLHVVASSSGSQVFTSSYFGREPDAPGAVNATRHHRLDERAKVLVLDGAFAGQVVVDEARPAKAEADDFLIMSSTWNVKFLAARVKINELSPVRAKGHGLVLKVALSALVTDRAVKRVVDQQELHNALPSLPGEVGVGLDAPAFHDGHGAGRDGLGRLLDFDEAHPTVSGDGEALVVAESGDLDADHGSRLKRKFQRSSSEQTDVTQKESALNDKTN